MIQPELLVPNMWSAAPRKASSAFAGRRGNYSAHGRSAPAWLPTRLYRCSHIGGSRALLTASSLGQVLFKLLLGSAKFGEAALFLSILGVFNVLFITCIPVILYFTRVEYWNSFDDIPWGNLCGFSILLLSKWRPPWEEAPANSNRHRTLWKSQLGKKK